MEIYFIVIAIAGTIWDVVTSFRGTFSIMEVTSSSLSNLLSENFTELIISLIVCFIITGVDYLFIDSFSTQKNIKRALKYAVYIGWSPVKLYDLWTAFIGTADVWFAEKLTDYKSVDLNAVFEVTTSGQRLVLLMICLVISACPMYLCWIYSSYNKS